MSRNLPRPNQEETENLNRPIMNKKAGKVIKIYPKEKPRADEFTGKFLPNI